MKDSALRRIARGIYHRGMDLAYAGKGLPIELNSGTYRVDPRYRAGFRTPYELEVADFLRERVRSGDTCYVVGANVGIYVLQFSSWNAPDGRIVAFEPNPESFAALQAHVRLNGLERRTTLINAAVSDRPGSATMFCSGYDGRSRLGGANDLVSDHAEEVEVPVVTLDDVAEEHGLWPDAMLMDVEGYELLAFRAAAKCLARGKGRMVMAVEMHPTMWKEPGTTPQEFDGWLRATGLEMVRITKDKEPYGIGGVVHLAWA